MTIIVTGGAGFIGSAVCRHLIAETEQSVSVIDSLTYASNPAAIAELENSPRFKLHQADICDLTSVEEIVFKTQPHAILHLAAESHVDRSISGSDVFIQTNVIGTHHMLKVTRKYWEQSESSVKQSFRFLHVSTDEVYGSLGTEGAFNETSPFDPSSPYSASKAASDHLVSAWHRTYDLPTLIVNCSNNFGPYQNREKLIPLMINNCLEGLPLPVYGNGEQVRDWIFVDDHVHALMTVLQAGVPGETYCVGSSNEWRNIDLVKAIISIIDELVPADTPRTDLISFVTDRLGHDVRYAIDASKIRALGWSPRESFEAALRSTVEWYIANRS